MYEALERLRFETFLDTLEEESRERILSLTMDLRDSFNEGKFHEYLESQPFNELFLEYEKFVAKSSGKSKTFAYLSMYMKMAGKMCFNCYSIKRSGNQCQFKIMIYLVSQKVYNYICQNKFVSFLRNTSDVHTSNKRS